MKKLKENKGYNNLYNYLNYRNFMNQTLNYLYLLLFKKLLLEADTPCLWCSAGTGLNCKCKNNNKFKVRSLYLSPAFTVMLWLEGVVVIIVTSATVVSL